MLVPPQLPSFLATVFDLKPITGVPSTEEVKLVHATIRALSPFLQTSELRDSDLPMELSQHLFDIQMVSYRERYPVGIFPNDITYTPPDLPAHIPVKLEPVIGPPSDDEIRSAHAALRMVDSFSNIASLFDADLSAQLSQHVFDLQLARHVQRSTRDQPSATRPAPQDHGLALAGPLNLIVTEGPNEIRGVETNTQQGQPPQDGNVGGTVMDDNQPLDIPRQGELTVTQEREGKNWLQETLTNIGETLENVNRALVGSQNSLARGFNSATYNSYSFNLGAHSLINDKGETPEMRGLPTLQDRFNYSGSISPDNLSPDVLARYLRFYGIGSDMIDDTSSEELTIKSGMESAAKTILRRRVYAHES